MVWLDNDSPYIVKKGSKIKEMTEMIGTDSDVVTDKSDPKYLSKDVLLEEIAKYV